MTLEVQTTNFSDANDVVSNARVKGLVTDLKRMAPAQYQILLAGDLVRLEQMERFCQDLEIQVERRSL